MTDWHTLMGEVIKHGLTIHPAPMGWRVALDVPNGCGATRPLLQDAIERCLEMVAAGEPMRKYIALADADDQHFWQHMQDCAGECQ